MPGWLNATIPSHQRGTATDAAIGKAAGKAFDYLNTHTPEQAGADIAGAVSKAWSRLEADHARAAAQGPEAEARWLGQIAGRASFEIASFAVPVTKLGLAGKAVGAAAHTAEAAVDIARAGDAVADGARVAGKLDDVSIPKSIPKFSFEILQQAKRTGISPEKIQELLDLKKAGQTLPSPETYMTAKQIAAHLAKFDEGIIRITSKKAVQEHGTLGPSPGFVFPKSEFDTLIKQTGGNLRALEQKLGLPKNYLRDGDTMIAVIEKKHAPDLKIPSGNEKGANDFWLPGGITSGGLSEATIAMPKAIPYNVIILGSQ